MATQTSSLIGAALTGLGGSTQLFALGSVATGTDGSRWEYVEATATFVTGEVVLVNTQGTAKTLTTALLTANPDGYDLGFVQNLVNQGEFAWIAKQGRGLYVLTTGTLTAASDNGLGFNANSGRVVAGTNCGVGNTLFGVFLTSSISSAAGPTRATLTWPRIVIVQ